MRYSSIQICFQEVPGEVSLGFFITGCNIHCKGCHSQEFWDKNSGDELDLDFFKDKLRQYSLYISCVLFFGGEWEPDFLNYLKLIKNMNLKTCLYTGLDINSIKQNILENLDFIKTGPWMESRGNITCSTTNQKFYDIRNKRDLTYIFQRGNDDTIK